MENENLERQRAEANVTTERPRHNDANAPGGSRDATVEGTLTGNIVADKKRDFDPRPIIAGIAVMAPHTNIDQRGATIIVQHGTPPDTKEDHNVGLNGNGVQVQAFLETMKKHVKLMTENNMTSTYDNLNEMDPKIQPSMGVVDLTKGYRGKISQESGDSRGGMDVEITDINLSQLHDPHMGKKPNLVFLLGDVGSGKTTASRKYANMVLNGEVQSLRGIELVHFVSVSELQDTRTTAFDLLVSQQVGLDEETKQCGKKWLTKNASKTLFVLDGLDQSSTDLSGKRQRLADHEAKARTRVILANILSGTLYPGMKILATSRWNTFWKLEKSLRSSKSVVLRGFDDQSLENAAESLVGKKESHDIIAALTNSSLLPLCRSPMFLIYAIEVFQENKGNPPESLTALMSAVLKHFEGSENWNDDIMTLTKLAYQGTIDNRYTFTENYVRSIGIDPSKLGGILTPSTRLGLYQSRPATGDTTWSFPHQSLQEFLGALGIFDEGQDKFDRFAENELNKSEMEIVRKFVYGMVLNPATRPFCETYLTDKSVSLEACKKTLMKQLNKLLPKRGVINDIKIISLLHECGPEVISHFKSRINRIRTNIEYLKSEDEYSLMSVIKQCVPMREVRIQRLEMNPAFMEQIRGFIDNVENFEIRTITVGRHITIEHCRELTALAPKIKVNHISMWTTDRVVSNLLQTWIDDKKAPCKRFAMKGRFSNDTFRKTGRFLSEIGADYLCFNQCNLTQEKFEVFSDSLEKGSKLSELCIYDDAGMAPEVYEDLTNCFNKGCVETLLLGECGLTTRKLDALNTGIDRNNVKLKRFHIEDEACMKPEAYCSLAGTIGKACVQALVLSNNEITVAKLQVFEDAVTEMHIKLQELKITDDANMTPDAYRGLAGVIGKACVQELVLGRNEATEAKLKALEDAAVKNQVKLQKLQIIDDANMTPDAYRGLAGVIGKACVQELILGRNEVTEAKLKALEDAAVKKQVKLQKLQITDDANMTPDAYRGLAGVIGKACVQELILGRNELTEAKLKALEDAAVKKQVKLARLQITGDGGVKPCMYRRLATTVGKIHVQTLGLDSNEMTEGKFREFSDGAEAGNVQLEDIIIMGEKNMNANVYRSIPSMIVKASAKHLNFQSNKVTEGKLRAFSDAAEENHVKMWQLSITEDVLDIQTIRELPTVVTKSQLTRLFLKNCAMTEDKFDNLADAAKRDGVQIRELQVTDKQMDEAAYYGLARAVGKANISWLIVLACDLTELKLEAFGKSIKANNVQFDQLYVWNDPIDVAVMSELAMTMKTASATVIVFAKCHLTKGKLQSFKESAERHNVKLVLFVIFFEPAMNDDCFEEIIQICQKTNANLQLHQCNVSDNRVRMLKEHIRNVSVS